jgi:hypothetical protein
MSDGMPPEFSRLWGRWGAGCGACFLLMALAGLALAKPQVTAHREHRGNEAKTMSTRDVDNSWCIGRFQFRLPTTLMLSGRSQSIYDVDVRTVPVPEQGPQAVWAERLARIRASMLLLGTASAELRTFDLLPGVPAVWYLGNKVLKQHLDNLRRKDEQNPQSSRQNSRPSRQSERPLLSHGSKSFRLKFARYC